MSSHIKFVFPLCWMLEEMKTGFRSFVYVVLFQVIAGPCTSVFDEMKWEEQFF